MGVKGVIGRSELRVASGEGRLARSRSQLATRNSQLCDGGAR
jgi:hypothetical protein